MVSKHRLLTILVVLLFGLLTLAQPVPQTAAQEEDPGPASGSAAYTAGALALDPVLIPGGPGFFSANALGFQPYPNGTTPIAFSGRSVYNPDTTFHYYQMPVYLPHMATITKFVIWGYDNDGSYNFWGAVAKMGQDDSYVQQMSYLPSSGTSTSLRVFTDTTIVDPLVDLQSYAYWVEIGMPPSASVRFTSFRIDYSYPTYAPAIHKP